MSKNHTNIDITVIGVMSGTSLDGLDLCYAQFTLNNSVWDYQILLTEDEVYPEEVKNKLASAQLMNALSYARLNSDYGIFLGQRIKAFIDKHSIKPDLISSHGHTIFHQPSNRFTAQIGSGACIAAETGINTICDFRSVDVALNGQGAPLVPIGDRYLFTDCDYCLNLGGFSNISFETENKRIAFDICPVNYVLNHYMNSVGEDYDNDGETARSGKVDEKLLNELNNLSYYTRSSPKSLGREDVENTFIPLIDSHNIELNNKLATFCEHVSIQISNNIKGGKILMTGGGAFNTYLVERMKINSPHSTYHIPDAQTVKFKEALIFAFLGVLYLYDIPNCLTSVTGAKKDNIGGALYKAARNT